MVTAVTTDSGWQPMLDNVMMSACSPAPPLGSVAAKTRTMGGRSDMRKGLQGMDGIRELVADGVIR